MDRVLAAAHCENPQRRAKPPQTATASSGTTHQADLAERFTPHVWLADLDSYDPMAAAEFVDGAELHWAHDRGCGDGPVTAEGDQRMLAGGEYRHQGPRPDREPTDAWTRHLCSEPDQLPAAMRGEWRSLRPADRPSSNKTYYVHLTLTGGAVDTDVGKIDTPAWSAAAASPRLAVEPDTVTLTETITDDSGEVSCALSGAVALTRDGDVLNMAYTTDDSEKVLTARLARLPRWTTKADRAGERCPRWSFDGGF